MVDSVIMSNQNIPNASRPAKFSGEGKPLVVADFLTRINMHLRQFEVHDYDRISYFLTA